MTNADHTYILDDIPFEPDINALAKRVRIKPGSPYRDELQHLVDTARACAQPKAIYRTVYIDAKDDRTVLIDGITFTSRVLAVNMGQAHRAFAFVATCGAELGVWAQGIDDMLQSFWGEAIKEDALRAASVALHQHLAKCYDLGKTATMNPGSLPDWPIQQQRPLFNLLGDPHTAIGVTLSESYLMEPNKSVSGVRFPIESRFESCMLCPREDCPGRRSAYDPELYDRKYRQK
ncbi:MAG: vitamin B12 dependent-methionine synthase activation domain-containing protein [Anaerolineae bacterium]|nr:vitamin B12 dependent-methionine synthase activation domain-containing protein [Anaerolineae bacterium]